MVSSGIIGIQISKLIEDSRNDPLYQAFSTSTPRHTHCASFMIVCKKNIDAAIKIVMQVGIRN